ncbi:MAG: hypothetical protein ACK2T3_03360, partial [Candidatus Promineifilaceae bacterium]
LAIGAIVVVWMANKPITDGALDLLGIADNALVRVDNVLGRTDEGIQEVRDFVSNTAEAIPGTQLAQRVNNVFLMVDSAADAAETANQVVGLTSKATGLFRREAEDRPIERVAEVVNNVAAKVEQVDSRVKEFQDRQIVQEVAMEIDGEIAEVQDSVRNVNASVNEAQENVSDLMVSVPRWIDLVSIILSLIFLWFGVAQLALASYGVQWVKGPSEGKAPETEQPPKMVEALDEPAEKAAEVAIPAAAAATAAVGATEDEETPSDVAEEEPKVTEEEILEDLDAAGEGEEE